MTKAKDIFFTINPTDNVEEYFYEFRIEDKVIGSGKLTIKPKWISVEDRLPEYGVEVLLWNGAGDFFLDFVIDCTNDEWEGCSPEQFKRYYTHWMPLPEPPKEE
jgi:hypothetical protein